MYMIQVNKRKNPKRTQYFQDKSFFIIFGSSQLTINTMKQSIIKIVEEFFVKTNNSF